MLSGFREGMVGKMVLKILGVANLLCLLINILRGNFDIAMMNIIAIILCCLNIVSSDK